jgi:hypothetical protein
MDKSALQNSLNSLEVWLIIFGVLAAIGAVGAVVVSGIRLNRSNQLQTIVETENLALQRGISEANARANEAALALEKFKAPRDLTLAQQKIIAMQIAPFVGLRAVLGAVPASERNVKLLEQILSALKEAGVDAFINPRGVEASVNPGAKSNDKPLPAIPSGVSAYFISGNRRAERFSKALSDALNQEGINATAIGGWREEWAEGIMKTKELPTRDDPDFEPVMVVVGDKPY